LRAALAAHASDARAVRAFEIFEEGGHSPHSERGSAEAVTEAALHFVHEAAATTDSGDPAPAADPARPADHD